MGTEEPQTDEEREETMDETDVEGHTNTPPTTETKDSSDTSDDVVEAYTTTTPTTT